jgi:hypothetical protein
MIEVDGVEVERRTEHFVIWYSGKDYVLKDYRPGPFAGLQEQFQDIFVFLAAWGTNLNDGHESDLFDLDLATWAMCNDAEFEVIAEMLAEPGLLT